MAAYRRGYSWYFMAFILFLGVLLGSILGELLGQIIPILGHSVGAGFPETTFRLANVLTLTLGFTLRINLATLVGFAFALWLVRR